MDTIFIIIALLLLGGGVALYKFKSSAKKPAVKKPAKKGNIVKKDDPFFEKNPDRDPLVKLAKDAAKKSIKKPRRRSKAKAKK